MTETVRHDTVRRESSSSQRPSSAVTVFSRRGAVWSEVTELGGAQYRIRLGGLFRTAWMAALCGGLADRRISIDQAHARLTPDGSWVAELNVITLPGAPAPATLSYLALSEVEDTPRLAQLALETYELRATPDHGGTLLLAIRAQDSLGLLGGLLASLTCLGLFPIEMHIETRGAWASDRMWLGSLDGHVPSSTTQAALDRLLARAVIG